MRPQHYTLAMLCLALVYSCSKQIRPESSRYRNKEAKIKIEEMQKWFSKLVKQGPDPIYLFETDTFNKNSNQAQDFRYILYDIDVVYKDEDPFIYDKQKREQFKDTQSFLLNNFGDEYYELFIQHELEKARSFLEENKLRYSKIFFQIPVGTDSLDVRDILKRETESEFYISLKDILKVSEEEFIASFGMNSLTYDSISIMTTYFSVKRENHKRDIDREFFQFSFNDVDSLVETDKYNPNFEADDLPLPLIKLIQQRFQDLKLLLPEILREKVACSKLYVGSVSDQFETSKLWLNNKDGDVYISPMLLRAAIIEELAFALVSIKDNKSKVNRIGESVKLVDNYSDILPRYSEDNRVSFYTLELESIYPEFINRIETVFDFVLLHEMGHSVLPLSESFDEHQCDSFAVSILKNRTDEVDLGIFSRLINSSEKYWPQTTTEAFKDIRRRYELINDKILKQ